MNYPPQYRSRRRLFVSLALMLIALLLFAYLQNQGMLVGGKIATAKLLWLFYAIFFWFALPILVLLDGRGSDGMRRIYKVFLLNMGARAVIELYMMYVSLNWHPYYGIGHDLFSLALLVCLLSVHRSTSSLDRLLGSNLWVISAMLLLETGFAWYLLTQVSDGRSAIYFVPADASHATVIWITWGAVLILSCYLYAWAKRWLYATA
jgi:hypothetical protein